MGRELLLAGTCVRAVVVNIFAKYSVRAVVCAVVLVLAVMLLADLLMREVFVISLQSQEVIVDSAVQVDDDSGLYGYNGKVVVVNKSFADVELIGVSATCSCIGISEYPKLVPARDSVEIPWQIRFKDGAGVQAISVFTNDPVRYKLSQRIVVSVSQL